MEKATLTSLGWTLGKNDILTSKVSKGANIASASNSVQIKRRFQFSSALKRQSSVATITAQHSATGKKIRSTFVGVKGAPETIMKMLVKVPADYERHSSTSPGKDLVFSRSRASISLLTPSLDLARSTN